MVTFFATPKPFRGHIGLIQRNAIQSWRAMHPTSQVLLFGTEEGAAEVAQEFGIQHIPNVARNGFGTPLLADLFSQAHAFASHPILCFINCDIVLGNNFLAALNDISSKRDRFLMVGQCWNLDLAEPLSFSESGWFENLQKRVRTKGVLRGHRAIDYFAFSRHLYNDIPPLVIGRTSFDNWMIWKAIATGATAVDASEVVTAVHQNHDYGHVPGGKAWSYAGDEAQENLRIAGKFAADFGIADTTHRLVPVGLEINWNRYPRLFKRWRRRFGLRRSRLRHLLGAKKTNLL